jgi:ribosome-binding factor A
MKSILIGKGALSSPLEQFINLANKTQRCRISYISINGGIGQVDRDIMSYNSNNTSYGSRIMTHIGWSVTTARRFSNFYGISVLDGLDKKKATVDKKTRQKLGRSLVDEESVSSKMLEESESGMSTQERAAMGYLKSLEEEICAIIQETILSTKIDLPGLRKTGKIIEIRNVILNRDFSHAEAFWESDMLTDFFKYSAQSMAQSGSGNAENNSDSSNSSNTTTDDSIDSDNTTKTKNKGLTLGKLQMFEDRIKQNINQALQNKEPVFRSAIIKRLEFRRVPRVFFKPYDLKNSKLLRQQNREEIVERALGEHVKEYGHLLDEEAEETDERDEPTR